MLQQWCPMSGGTTSPTSGGLPPAGWYPDASGHHRWWDGSAWGPYAPPPGPEAPVGPGSRSQPSEGPKPSPGAQSSPGAQPPGRPSPGPFGEQQAGPAPYGQGPYGYGQGPGPGAYGQGPGPGTYGQGQGATPYGAGHGPGAYGPAQGYYGQGQGADGYGPGGAGAGRPTPVVAIFAHLSCIIGGIILAGVLYAVTDRRDRFTKAATTAALDFSITVFLAAIAFVVVFVAAGAARVGALAGVAALLYLAVAVVSIVWGIKAAVRANRYELWRYPVSLRIFAEREARAAGPGQPGPGGFGPPPGGDRQGW